MASQAVAERRDNPVQVIRQNLTQMAPEFQAALPKHVTVEKFTRVTMTAIQNNPDLMQKADRRSLFGAVVRLAQDGLLPDGREAAIVLFGDKAQAMPMIAGILKKVRQSGDVSYVSAQIVYSNDRFKWTLGFDENVEHEPAPLDQDPGEPVAAYAVAVLKDGSRLLEVMRKSEIEKVRQVSRAKNAGPWTQWWGEMARKTVMRRLSKRLPMSTDLDDAFERDETMKRAADAPALQVVDHDPEPISRLDALEQHIEAEAEEVHDAETGEIETNDGTFSDENPAATEGPADEQRGDGFTDDATERPAWFFKVETIRKGVAAAKNKQHVKDFDDEFIMIRAGLPDEVIEELEALIADKRRALTKTAAPAE